MTYSKYADQIARINNTWHRKYVHFHQGKKRIPGGFANDTTINNDTVEFHLSDLR